MANIYVTRVPASFYFLFSVLVLAVIVGIGSNLFAEFHGAIGTEPSIDQALAVMLAALSLLGLGIFGPGIATGLVSGAPQLGAGAAAGTALAGAGLAVAGGAALAGGARLAASGGGAALRSATTLSSGARAAYAEGKAASGASGMRATAAGFANVARGAGRRPAMPMAPPRGLTLQLGIGGICSQMQPPGQTRSYEANLRSDLRRLARVVIDCYVLDYEYPARIVLGEPCSFCP